MKTLCVMCGCSGSGKSTIANMMVDLNDNWRLVSTDNIRAELFGDAGDQQQGNLVFSTAYDRIGDFLTDPNINGVVFDATNLTPRSRSEIFRRFGNFNDVEISAVNVICDLEDCLLRQSYRDRKVPEEVIRSQYNKFKPATLAEGFSKIANQYT